MIHSKAEIASCHYSEIYCHGNGAALSLCNTCAPTLQASASAPRAAAHAPIERLSCSRPRRAADWLKREHARKGIYTVIGRILRMTERIVSVPLLRWSIGQEDRYEQLRRVWGSIWALRYELDRTRMAGTDLAGRDPGVNHFIAALCSVCVVPYIAEIVLSIFAMAL